MTRTFRMLIAGALVNGDSTFDVIDPATEAVIAACPKASESQLEQAVASARNAFPALSAKTYEQRAAYYRKACRRPVRAQGRVRPLANFGAR